MSLAKIIALCGGRVGTPQLRNSATLNNSSIAPKPTGAAVGDLVVVVAGSNGDSTNLNTASGSSWTICGADTNKCYIFYKILNATDVANNWVWTGTTRSSIAWLFTANGATTLTQRDVVISGATASTVSSSGYAPRAASRA